MNSRVITLTTPEIVKMAHAKAAELQQKSPELSIMLSSLATRLDIKNAAIVAMAGNGLEFFSYDPIDGNFQTHKTIEEAQNSAEEYLDYCRACAAEGWPKETEQVCWGVVIQSATMFNKHKPDPLTEDASFSYMCEYDLKGVDVEAVKRQLINRDNK